MGMEVPQLGHMLPDNAEARDEFRPRLRARECGPASAWASLTGPDGPAGPPAIGPASASGMERLPAPIIAPRPLQSTRSRGLRRRDGAGPGRRPAAPGWTGGTDRGRREDGSSPVAVR